jgi:hypothetical protein
MKGLRYYSDILLEESRETTKTFRHDCPNSNQVHKECKSDILMFDDLGKWNERPLHRIT